MDYVTAEIFTVTNQVTSKPDGSMPIAGAGDQEHGCLRV